MCTHRAFSLPAASSPHSSVEDAIGRHDTIDVHEQQGEQGALLVRAEIDPMTVSERFERAEDAELHHVPPADQHRLTRNLTADPPR